VPTFLHVRSRHQPAALIQTPFTTTVLVQEFFVPAAELVVTALLLVPLRWAAIERAKAHREWAALQRELGEKGPPVIDWCPAWAIAGCV
jgi:hypothetical protein